MGTQGLEHGKHTTPELPQHTFIYCAFLGSSVLHRVSASFLFMAEYICVDTHILFGINKMGRFYGIWIMSQ